MKYNELEAIIKTPYFFRKDLILSNYKIYDYQLTGWCNKKYLIKIKNGLYMFNNRMDSVDAIELSQLIYEPSYISMESALRYYNFIPEMVYAITCVTTKANRNFKNVAGNYIYSHIKPELFFGYIPIKTKYGYYYVAEPEKAVLDFIYLKLSQINNDDEFNELRLNLSEISSTINKKKFNQYLNVFNIKKMSEVAKLCLL